MQGYLLPGDNNYSSFYSNYFLVCLCSVIYSYASLNNFYYSDFWSQVWNFYIHPRTHNFPKSKLHQALAFLQEEARALESVTLTSNSWHIHYCFLTFQFYLVGVSYHITVCHHHCFIQSIFTYTCCIFTSLFVFHSILHSNFSSKVTFLLPERKSFRICFHEGLWVTKALTFSLSLMSLFPHLFSLSAFKILSSSLNFES